MGVVFHDREEAGRQLAKRLAHLHGTDALMLAIPRGGVPIAAAAAHRLQLEWNIMVVHKLPIPWNPEAGFGAVAADGSVVLNEPMVRALRMRREQIDEVAEEVRAEVVRRAELFAQERPAANVDNRCAVLVDDGLASGYTMLAAIKSLRSQHASRVIAAAPVASRSAAALIEGFADECVIETVSQSVPFAVADSYVAWHDLTDEDVMRILRAPSI
jgi:predicted phosphoribosyltransferase